MPQLVSCPNCLSKLRVPDTALGKKVKCPGCGGVFATALDPPPPVEEDEADNGYETEQERRKRPRTEEEGPASERARSRRRTDDDEDDRPRRRRRDEEEDEERPRKRKRKKRRASGTGFLNIEGLDTPTTVILGTTAVCIVMSLTSILFPPLALIPIGVSLVMMIGGGLWFLLVAFQDSALHGVLCLCVPFYSIYYLISHLGETWKPFALNLLGVVVYMVAACAGGMGLSLWQAVLK